MQFCNEALDRKKKYIDQILQNTDLLKTVLNREFEFGYSIHPVERIWEGGGSTQYLILTNGRSFFLKVKSSSVTVESKLEEESGYNGESCLENEYHMLMDAKNISVSVPRVVFFCKEDGFDFLCMEYIEDSLEDALRKQNVEGVISIWNQIESNVRILFQNGIIHTDIHEQNIRCLGDKVYLIDFEEARYLKQTCPFEESLDYVGYNKISTLGKYPYYMTQEYSVPYNCLSRLKEVINKEMARKIFKFAQECNYDSLNGICISLDHGSSNKTYQEISNNYFSIGGQRSNDTRINLISMVCDEIMSDGFTFIDVGSNNGLFGRELAKMNDKVERCIGLEGFSKFNVLARGLAFIENVRKTEYIDFLCGEDSIDKINITSKTAISICSVWHHIENREQFLSELKKLDVELMILEFATQKGIYGDNAWEEELKVIQNSLSLKGYYELMRTNDYDRPFVMLTKERIPQKSLQKIMDKYSNFLCESNEPLQDTKKFDQYINRERGENKYIVCFGAGEYGKIALKFLKGKVVFFIDNDSSKKEFEGLKVLSLDSAKDILSDDTTVIVSTSSKYYGEIEQQLERLGIRNVIYLDRLLENGYMLDELR